MPQLQSGRHFALTLEPFKTVFSQDTDFNKYMLIGQYVAGVQSPADLLTLATVVYFTPGGGGPPDGEVETSGFTAGAVLAGETDWTEAEVEEFRAMSSSERFARWLAEESADIDALIKQSSVWKNDDLKWEG